MRRCNYCTKNLEDSCQSDFYYSLCAYYSEELFGNYVSYPSEDQRSKFGLGNFAEV